MLFYWHLDLRLLQRLDEVLLDEGPLPLEARLTRGRRLSPVRRFQVGERRAPAPWCQCYETFFLRHR
jgi:hypothetical protein